MEEEVIFQFTELNNKIPINAEQYNMFDDIDVIITYQNEETLIYYDCLADSATTSHILNYYKAFTTFNPIYKMKVGGVSGIQMHAKGHGTVELKSVCEG